MNFSPVTLTEMLETREKRSNRRQRLINIHRSALIQLSINSPGSEKNSSVISDIFSEGLRILKKEFSDNIIDCSSDKMKNTGPVAFIAVKLPAELIKKRTSDLETAHPLGRLWDIDVYSCDQRLLSRKELNLPERKCFICGEAAHTCARSRRHKQEELKAYIMNIYNSYSSKNRIS